ncbi:helix-turn-helix domain-containing protein [Amycolatopsis mediterranei]|uniref:helix-turn-helix domain-containing protein n=1 Tax=Amycolatopsis mediterranei TaxID=33910 RepID=UPI00223174A9|nr:helix-turn-helix transcriptional regulator [Amycolatopsis mediterranei]UZF73859.1 helix-turn-helix domain-containing protein [Amycolatopsis mediterranei]
MADETKAKTAGVRMRRIARTILAWRTASGQDQMEVAKAVGWSNAKQSRIETAKLPITPADVMTLALHFGRPAEERDALFRDAQAAQSSRWLDQISAEAFAADVREYVALESEASEARIFKIDVVPGLFQTEDYARAISMLGSAPDDERREERVQARIRRQARLQDEAPLRVRCVLTEAVLRLQVGGREAWLEQLRRIADLMEVPNVDIRFLKSENGAYRAMGYPFTVLSFDDSEPDIGYIELLRAGVYLEQDTEVQPYVEAFEELWTSAEEPAESRELLTEIIGAAG